MQGITPLPPPVPLPGAFEIPVPTLAPPVIAPFAWEPIPIYREDIPEQPKTPTEEKPAQEAEEEKQPPKQEPPPPDPVQEMPEPIAPELPELPEEILAEVQTIEVPFVGVEVPVPRPEILVTATATAGISSVAAVGGTLAAQTVFRQLQPILKPVFKFALKKLAAIRKKPPRS